MNEKQPKHINVHINRLFKGMVDLRSYILAEALRSQIPVVFTCDEFPGEKMTLPPAMLVSARKATSEPIRSKFINGDTPEVYTLVSYTWRPDGSTDIPINNQQQGSLF